MQELRRGYLKGGHLFSRHGILCKEFMFQERERKRGLVVKKNNEEEGWENGVWETKKKKKFFKRY